ncbi:uncharacterized protein [Spinacia oleracea]|uniref:Uncharacterized protein isoform X1 n=1 Tax=Spinacia oleracea TaxID=3562 RepID=A0ABM3QJ34_SPIOL|nr:uncharacterized protein LOC130459812 isoform X1 [Spinacia oleracea]
MSFGSYGGDYVNSSFSNPPHTGSHAIIFWWTYIRWQSGTVTSHLNAKWFRPSPRFYPYGPTLSQLSGNLVREQGFAAHQAFLASTRSVSNRSDNNSTSSTTRNNFEGSRSNNGSRGGGKGRGKGRGGRGKGRGGGANQTQAQTQNSGGTALCNSVLSSDSAVVALASCGTNNLFAGNYNVEGVFGPSPTNIVCQICFHPGHSAVACPSRYSQNSNAALASLPAGEHNETTWFPDSGASSHITNDLDNQLLKASSQGSVYPITLINQPRDRWLLRQSQLQVLRGIVVLVIVVIEY